MGTGFYFWDYDIEGAKWWGRTHYSSCYSIFEAEIPYNERMLDLVGNRKHMEWFLDSINDAIENEPELENAGIAERIEYLKRLAKEHKSPDIFPFDAIRAIDIKADIKEPAKLSFLTTPRTRGAIILNPRIIICVINKEIIQNFKYISGGNRRF